MIPQKTVSFKPEYACDLIEIAKGDLQTAKALIASADPGRLENILYMIQQCVKKSIKSVLIFKQTSLPMVHDLGILVALLPVKPEMPSSSRLIQKNQCCRPRINWLLLVLLFLAHTQK